MSLALPRYRVRFLHVTAIWAYGVSQPVFALVGGNPDLLIARNATWASAVLFAVLIAVVPPALVVGYAWFAGRFSAWIGDTMYLLGLGACLLPLSARVVKLLDAQLALSLALVVVLAVAGVVLYVRVRPIRSFVGYSIVLPIVSLVWFVHGLPDLTDEAQASSVRVRSPVPIVFIQLDEMPGSALMTRDGQLDAVRYPNFARLARDGVWYRNATTVHEWTSNAVPSILSGQIGTAYGLPTLRQHPQNLFTLLGDAYSFHVHESLTRMCPRNYCPRREPSVLENGYALFTDSFPLLATRVLPTSVSDHVVHVNDDIEEPNGPPAVAALNSLVRATARERRENVLMFDHVLLPHTPWRFFPSGTEYDRQHIDGWFSDEHWSDDTWLALQGYQRFLLQVGYVDRVIGEIVRTLDLEGLYDRSLIVVLSDHGVSFRAGQGRRPLTGNNLADIVNNTMFVKYPHGLRRGVDSRPAHTVDVLPTIADVLGIRIPWHVDGLSLLGPIPANREIVIGRRGGRDPLRVPLGAVVRDRDVTVRFKAEQFGQGRDSLFRIGAHEALLGRDVSGESERSTTVAVTVENPDTFLHVSRSSGFSPARISAHVTSGRLAEGDELAIAVNGRVRGLTTWFWDEDGQVQRFRSLVPEGSFHPGRNAVDVFLIRGPASNPSVVLLGSS
jgi:Sulfatase